MVACQFAMRNSPVLVWQASSLDFESVLESIESDLNVWDESEYCFASFPTATDSIVCLNLDYLQLAQAVESAPDPQLGRLPEDRARIWLDGRSEPVLVSAGEPDLLAFQTFFEVNETVSVIRWVSAEGRAVVVRVAEIVALEYPASWGSQADEDIFGHQDDVIPF